MIRDTIADRLFPPRQEQTWWARALAWMRGSPFSATLLPSILLLLLGVLVQQAFEGEFVAHAELLPENNGRRQLLSVRLVNNSAEVVSVDHLEPVVTAEGKVCNGVTRTVRVTSSHRYSVKLPDVLPSGPARVSERTGHSVSPGKIDEFEVERLLAENISVTGSYTVEPMLFVHDAKPLWLETVSFPAITNRADTVPATQPPSNP